jgi:hypothetical protein
MSKEQPDYDELNIAECDPCSRVAQYLTCKGGNVDSDIKWRKGDPRENLRGKLFKGAGNLIKDAENYGDARN